MKKKQLWCILLILSLVCLSAVPLLAAASAESARDSAYEFPIVPETEEWKGLKNLEEKLAVCQIPEDRLAEMSTEALIETVANFPLTVNLFAYDTPEQGYRAVREQFNGLAELERRFKADPQAVDSVINAKLALMSEDRFVASDDTDSEMLNYYFLEAVSEQLSSTCLK